MTSVHYEIRRSSPGSSSPDLLGDTALNPTVLCRHCCPAPGSTRASKDNKAEYSEIEEVLTLEAIAVVVRNWRMQTGRQCLSYTGGRNKIISSFAQILKDVYAPKASEISGGLLSLRFSCTTPMFLWQTHSCTSPVSMLSPFFFLHMSVMGSSSLCYISR